MNRIRTNVVTSILVVCGAAAGAIAQPVYIGGHEYAALGSAVGTALVGMAIAHGSISVGLRISLVVCVALCGAVAWLASKIQMKNT